MRTLLDHYQCGELLDLWLEAHAAIEALRARPLGVSLRRVPVPTRLTESIVALEAPRLVDADAAATSGRGGNDLAALRGGQPVGIAVKGSTAGWVSITCSDRRADVLVWLDFAPLLTDPTAAIEAHVFRAAEFADVADRLLLRRAPAAIRRTRLSLTRRKT